MKKIIRYQCEWCGKEFRTPDRHKCRWAPEAHNCLSCKHRGKAVDDVLTEFGDRWLAFECPYFEDPCEAPCDFAEGAVSKTGNNCPHWELITGYLGKNTFAAMESDRVAREHGENGESKTDEAAVDDMGMLGDIARNIAVDIALSK